MWCAHSKFCSSCGCVPVGEVRTPQHHPTFPRGCLAGREAAALEQDCSLGVHGSLTHPEFLQLSVTGCERSGCCLCSGLRLVSEDPNAFVNAVVRS